MRRRFIANPNPPYGWIEIFEDIVPRRDDLLYGDRNYDGLRATDGTDISTRTKHREYMKLNNLAMVDDFKETWAKAREARDKYFTQGGSTSREDVARAIHTLESSRRTKK